MPSYTVSRGDSFWEIAERVLGDGSRYREIAAANGLRPDAVIQPGQVLNIPGAEPADTQGGIPEPTTREGVRALQAELAAAGFDPGPIDGIMGPRTRAAMEERGARRSSATDMWSLPGNASNGRRPAPQPAIPPPGPVSRPIPQGGLGRQGAAPALPSAPPMARATVGAPIPVPPPGGQGRNYAVAPQPPPPPRPVQTVPAPPPSRPDLVQQAMSQGRGVNTHIMQGPGAVGFAQLPLEQSPVANLPGRITPPTQVAPPTTVQASPAERVPGSIGAFSPQALANQSAPFAPGGFPSGMAAPVTPVIHDGPTPIQTPPRTGIEDLMANPSMAWPPPGPSINAPPMMPAGGVPRVPNNAILPEGGREYAPPMIMNAQPQTDAAGRPLEDRAQMMRERLGPPPTNNETLLRRLMEMGLPPEAIQRLIQQLTGPGV